MIAISLPVNLLAFVLEKIRWHRYDPEKVICPGCGFRGDSGTNGKTCRIRFIAFGSGFEENQAGIQHTCFRCGNDRWYSQTFVAAEKWIAKKAPGRTQNVTPMKVQEKASGL